jgi:hypothetical protein
MDSMWLWCIFFDNFLFCYKKNFYSIYHPRARDRRTGDYVFFVDDAYYVHVLMLHVVAQMKVIGQYDR